MQILLCLHGWGGSKESFIQLRKELKNTNIKIIAPDLPGFGNEPEPNLPWSVDDYAEWTKYFIQKKINQLAIYNYQLSILGHSFGGRIAIKLATKNDLKINHLFLCASAGIKHPKHIKRTLGLTLAKSGNAILSIPIINKLKQPAKKILYKILRVHDYEQASSLMQKTMIKVSEEDLKPLLSEITVPTDIFWGKNDTITPISDAYIMHHKIKNSILHTYPSIRHRVHKDKAKEISEIIISKLHNFSNLEK